MNIEYDGQTMWKLYESSAIMKGLEDVKAGRTVDGDSVISNVREKYGV